MLNKGFISALVFPERGPRKIDQEVKIEIKSFLRIMSFLEWPRVFTEMVGLSRVSRKLLMKNHMMVCADKHVCVDLSGTTKLLKKMPRWLAVRMNFVRAKLKSNCRMDRI